MLFVQLPYREFTSELQAISSESEGKFCRPDMFNFRDVEVLTS